jgi:membrane protein DedA with SNARE-associated domain/membrane-associated phospholipid phosphatase
MPLRLRWLAMVERILDLHGGIAYAIIFAVPALEASVFLGFVFPGEIAVLLGGVLAFQGRISLAGAMAAAIAGAIIGDSIGYEVGRHFGPRILAGPLRRFVKVEQQERATAFLHRNGGKAVFFGRFTAALRVLVPGMAGIAGIPYPTFLFFNALGGVLWAGGFTLIGYAAGNGYRRVEHIAGRASVTVLGLTAAIVLMVLAARWIARNPERVRAWWARQRARRLLRRFGRQLDFLGRRFRPGEAFGLALTFGIVAVGIVGVLFGVVVQDVSKREELVHLDRPVLNSLMHHSEGGLSAVMKVVSVFGGTPLIAGVALAVALGLALRRAWPRVVLVLAVPAGALLLERGVAVLVRRPLPPVHRLVPATGFSFPSAHATIAAAFYAALALLLGRAMPSWSRKVAVWAAAFIVVAVIGFSRLYLRVSYLTDVLGGFALGALWLGIVSVVNGAWVRARANSGKRLPSAEPA